MITAAAALKILGVVGGGVAGAYLGRKPIANAIVRAASESGVPVVSVAAQASQAARDAKKLQVIEEEVIHDHKEIALLRETVAQHTNPARRNKKIAVNGLISALASAATVALLPHIPFALPVIRAICEAVVGAN